MKRRKIQAILLKKIFSFSNQLDVPVYKREKIACIIVTYYWKLVLKINRAEEKDLTL